MTTEELKQTRQYLLGILPQENLADLEERLLRDKDFYEELLVAEDELIDEYLADRLSGVERERAESYFLIAPERQQKLRFSRAFKKYIETNEAERPRGTAKSKRQAFLTGRLWSVKSSFFPPNRNTVVAFSLIVALCVGLFALSRMVFHDRSSETIAQRQPQSVLKIALISGSTRGDGAIQRVLVPPVVDAVQLEIELERNEYKSYRAELLTAENSSLTIREGIRPEVTNGRGVVYFILPARTLKPGDYQVRLDGIAGSGSKEPVDKYRFRVIN